MARIPLLNLWVDNLTMDETVAEIDRLVRLRRPSYLVTPNLDHVVMLEKDAEFREAYARAALVLTDGQPLVWISRLSGRRIAEKVSGSDLFPRVCALAAEKGYTMYFLGAAEGVAAKAARNLEKAHPGLRVVGTYSPPYGFEKDAEKTRSVVERVAEAKPDILALALGSPKQEKFAYWNCERMNVPVSLNIGAGIDFAAGNVRRAPRWMSRCGLEWLYRTLREPRRLAGRYFKDACAIVPIMWKYRARRPQ